MTDPNSLLTQQLRATADLLSLDLGFPQVSAALYGDEVHLQPVPGDLTELGLIALAAARVTDVTTNRRDVTLNNGRSYTSHDVRFTFSGVAFYAYTHTNVVEVAA